MDKDGYINIEDLNKHRKKEKINKFLSKAGNFLSKLSSSIGDMVTRESNNNTQMVSAEEVKVKSRKNSNSKVNKVQDQDKNENKFSFGDFVRNANDKLAQDFGGNDYGRVR